MNTPLDPGSGAERPDPGARTSWPGATLGPRRRRRDRSRPC